jgi:predicted dienelactone hydrolase
MRSTSSIGLFAAIGSLIIALDLIAAAPGFSAESSIPRQNLNIAGLTVAFWRPPDNAPKPWPIIVFSHGFHGCDTQSTFLMEALAAAGYAVFAPNHRDAACGNLRAWLKPPDPAFRKPDEWSDATYRDRAEDIEKLIDALTADPTYDAPPYESREVGLVGHSLGGYTVLGLGGAWPSWKDSRVKAIVALSPYSNPFVRHRTLGAMGAPVMYQGGTRDCGITAFVAKGDGAYQ